MLQLKFFRNILPLIMQARRGYCVTQSILNSPCLRTREQICSLPQLPHFIQSRGFKDKDVLTKRCQDCYFQRIDGRWFVFCRTHPRHKQRQRIDEKSKWIITHATHGRKKF